MDNSLSKSSKDHSMLGGKLFNLKDSYNSNPQKKELKNKVSLLNRKEDSFDMSIDSKDSSDMKSVKIMDQSGASSAVLVSAPDDNESLRIPIKCDI